MGQRSLSVTFVLLMWDEWRASLEIMIMHSRTRREACLVCVWCVPVCAWGGVTFHLCACPLLEVKVIKVTGDILVIDWEPCVQQDTVIYEGFPGELQRLVHVFMLQCVCVCHWADSMNEFQSISFENWICSFVNYGLWTALGPLD